MSSCQECSLCGYLTPDLRSHIGHLRLVHKDDPSFSVACGIRGCSERFTKFSAFNTHIYRKHRGDLGLKGVIAPNANDSQPEGICSESITDHYGPEEESPRCDDSGILTFDDHQTIPTHNYTDNHAKMLLELSEGRKLSEVAIQDVITGCRSVCTQLQSQMKDVIYEKLSEHDVDSTIIDDVMEAMTSSYQDPFMKLSSSYLREKYYKEHFPYLVSTDTAHYMYV